MTVKPHHEEVELSVKSLDTVREGILNALLNTISIMALLPLVASLYRIVDIGWQNIMLFQAIAYLVICATAIFQRRLLFYHKALILIFFAFLIGCVAIIKMGLIGGGVLFLFFSIVLATMFVGVRYGCVLIIAGLALLVTVAIGVNKGWILFDFNIGATAVAFSSWISKIFAFALFTTMLIVSLGRLITHLVDSSYILSERTEKLKRTNENLLEEIADKKRAEVALQKSEEKYRILAENATDVIWTTDLSLNTTYVSPSAQRVRGYTVEEIMAQSIEERLTPDSLAAATQTLSEELEMEGKEDKDLLRSRTLELETPCKDGSTKWSETKLSFIRDLNGKAIGIMGVGRDITDRKRAEETLQESEEKYRHLFEMESDVIILIRRDDGQILEVNKAGTKLYGYTRNELLKMKNTDLSAEPEETRKSTIEGRKRVPLRYHRKKDGNVFPVEISGSQLNWQGQDARIAAIRDISARIETEEEKAKLEAQLMQAQKMEAIGTLAGGIAHDFNNILSAIIGYSELALEYANDGSNLERDLLGVIKAGGRAKDLVKQILTFSRQSEQELKPLQIGIIVKEVLKLLRPTLPTTIEIRQDIESDSTVMADATQVHQILMNICTNASHAMAIKGGALDLSLKDVEIDTHLLSQHPEMAPGSYVKLTVKDTGHGMTPDIVERIFDPYFTTKGKREGTGLGLSVVHGIVRSYRGTVTVQSEPGKGSMFNVFLPILENHDSPEIETKEPLPAGKERVLFVDDEPTLVEITNQMLRRLGYDVDTRTSSIEALELFKAQPDRFDLVITDMTMPGMTGDELARKIIRVKSNMPIILCTGYSQRINKKMAIELGIKAFLMKPVVMQELAHIVRNVLDNKKNYVTPPLFDND